MCTGVELAALAGLAGSAVTTGGQIYSGRQQRKSAEAEASAQRASAAAAEANARNEYQEGLRRGIQRQNNSKQFNAVGNQLSSASNRAGSVDFYGAIKSLTGS